VTKPTVNPTVEKVLRARRDYLLAGHPMPTKARLPPADAAAARKWIEEQVEKDPFIGRVDSGLSKQFAGMEWYEDPAVSAIVIE
jgi:hypothetical protein